MVDALDAGHLISAWRLFQRGRGDHDNGGNESTHGVSKSGDKLSIFFPGSPVSISPRG